MAAAPAQDPASINATRGSIEHEDGERWSFSMPALLAKPSNLSDGQNIG